MVWVDNGYVILTAPCDWLSHRWRGLGGFREHVKPRFGGEMAAWGRR